MVGYGLESMVKVKICYPPTLRGQLDLHLGILHVEEEDQVALGPGMMADKCWSSSVFRGMGCKREVIAVGRASIPIPSDVATSTNINNDIALQNDQRNRGQGLC
ncbi:hypothetical protein CVT25_005362 [Psilocybe cyanescens]|uniref:Uncharacterized protein n=1 Tax=Psilocybe cyanescens TaxID=93625 RepID=A0A409XS38_PSICY|nr:hypothetical protein CVT25_005362 [Psilocybe cyanescens]